MEKKKLRNLESLTKSRRNQMEMEIKEERVKDKVEANEKESGTVFISQNKNEQHPQPSVKSNANHNK